MKPKNSCFGLTLSAVFLTNVVPANALESLSLNSSCAEYYSEMQLLLEQHKKAGLTEATFRMADRNPAFALLKSEMRSLDNFSRDRILVPLAERVWFNCLNLQDSGLRAKDTIEASLVLAIEFYGLDMMKPQWGLIELPEIDFDVMGPHEVDVILSNIPGEAVRNPVNDVFRVAFNRYLTRFDLSSAEALKKVNRLAVDFTYESYAPEHEGKTYSEILDEIAERIGLVKL